MHSYGTQTLSDYLRDLQGSPERLDDLIESVVVPETSFFRNRASFFFLRQWVSKEWSLVRKENAATLRVLSLPCSTGEEPYSIAIMLLEEGLPMDAFHIDGVDISLSALKKAKQGIYSPYAFRRQGYRSDDKYFSLGVPKAEQQTKRVTHRYYLADAVCEKVNFHQGNILDSQLLSAQPLYDVIFCRNLLIYFDQKARDRTFAKLDSLLRPNGLLFLGYAETSLVDRQQYQPVSYPETFAYYKRTQKQHYRRPATAETSVSLSSAGFASNFDCDLTNDFSLRLAQELANKGEIEQAMVACDRYLATHPSTASAYLLRGDLHQRMHNSADAEVCYEKAIYLDPHSNEALLHLMRLKEEQKDMASAALIHSRLQGLAHKAHG